MNRAETQWLDDLGEYERMGGYVPENIRADMFYCFCTNEWEITVYGRQYNIHLDSFRDVMDWVEENGPDLPTPSFGL